MLMATVAFSVDAMLPALPSIAGDVAAGDVKQAAMVISTFMIGLGLGTLFAGPLSDAYGRHAIAVGGAAIFIPASLLAAVTGSIELLLVARFAQGIGASGPRIVALAIVRDLYVGRQMARTISFVMTVFAIVPVLAPSVGAVIDWAFGWRAIFIAFALFSAISILWLKLRQPETHPVSKRRPFRVDALKSGLKDILSNRMVMRSVMAQSLVYTILFISIMSSQPVIDQTFGRAASFPLWFGAIAMVAAGASFLNAAVVVRLGMAWVIRLSLTAMAVYALFYAGLLSLIDGQSTLAFALFLALICAGFSLAGLCIGNLNAIAMQPMGHIAGLAASAISAISTSLGALLASLSTLFFDGTALPATLGILISATIARLLAEKLSEEAEAAT